MGCVEKGDRGVKWTIGSNSSLKFWHDKWLNVGTLRSLVEDSLARGGDNLMVKDVITNGTWDLHRLSFPLTPFILNAIYATTLRRISEKENQLSWISSINGEFDSRNAYLLVIGDDLSASDFLVKWAWKVKTLPNIQVFLWKCLHNSLFVKSILTHRGIKGLGRCAFCLDNEESILHVLRECPVV